MSARARAEASSRAARRSRASPTNSGKASASGDRRYECLLAFFDSDEPDHRAVSAVLGAATEPLVVSPYVVAEVDYLVASRLVTLDHRHFDVVRPLTGGRFTVLP